MYNVSITNNYIYTIFMDGGNCRSRFQRGPFSRFEASQRELPGEVE
jgi:hypothetical protein